MLRRSTRLKTRVVLGADIGVGLGQDAPGQRRKKIGLAVAAQHLARQTHVLRAEIKALAEGGADRFGTGLEDRSSAT
jgi:hypothetical protein